MGSLKPGVHYIYERQDGTVYAREHGKPASERIAIGWDWESDDNPARVRGASRESMLENQLWHQIRLAAKTNSTLHDTLERAKMLYYLSKSNGK